MKRFKRAQVASRFSSPRDEERLDSYLATAVVAQDRPAACDAVRYLATTVDTPVLRLLP